jgi:hypothetical protein
MLSGDFMGIARIRMIDFFNAEDSQAFEEEYVKVAGSLLPLATNLIMTRTSDDSLLHIAIYNSEQDADASLAPIQNSWQSIKNCLKIRCIYTDQFR